MTTGKQNSSKKLVNLENTKLSWWRNKNWDSSVKWDSNRNKSSTRTSYKMINNGISASKISNYSKESKKMTTPHTKKKSSQKNHICNNKKSWLSWFLKLRSSLSTTKPLSVLCLSVERDDSRINTKELLSFGRISVKGHLTKFVTNDSYILSNSSSPMKHSRLSA